VTINKLIGDVAVDIFGLSLAKFHNRTYCLPHFLARFYFGAEPIDKPINMRQVTTELPPEPLRDFQAKCEIVPEESMIYIYCPHAIWGLG
jgi:hypothetical protein